MDSAIVELEVSLLPARFEISLRNFWYGDSSGVDGFGAMHLFCLFDNITIG